MTGHLSELRPEADELQGPLTGYFCPGHCGPQCCQAVDGLSFDAAGRRRQKESRVPRCVIVAAVTLATFCFRSAQTLKPSSDVDIYFSGIGTPR